MPELPEVETIKLGLSKKIINKKITDIVVYNKKSFQGNKSDVLQQGVIDVERRAKVLRIILENSQSLLFHLKMTGQLIYIDRNKRVAGGHPSHDWHDKLPNKHTRVQFTFDNGAGLFFNDLRKFGWCKVMNQEEVEKSFGLFGPEPFSNDFNLKYLLDKAKRYPARTIKQFLMDQTVVAGIGNIYNDEALFLSEICPKTKVSKLTSHEWQKIITNVRKVLTKGIKYGGTTDSDYVDADGKSGGMQNHLNVYHKTGEKCQSGCGGIIERIVIGGRGTYFCPNCQKEKI
jgi:formamidopyrimidine-DNA glycosylase